MCSVLIRLQGRGQRLIREIVSKKADYPIGMFPAVYGRMTTRLAILAEFDRAFPGALSDEDLATRLDKSAASIRRTRRLMYEAREIRYSGLDVGANQETFIAWRD